MKKKFLWILLLLLLLILLPLVPRLFFSKESAETTDDTSSAGSSADLTLSYNNTGKKSVPSPEKTFTVQGQGHGLAVRRYGAVFVGTEGKTMMYH